MIAVELFLLGLGVALGLFYGALFSEPIEQWKKHRRKWKRFVDRLDDNGEVENE